MIPPAVYIADSAALAAAVERLRAHDRIACDTESNSLHAYREKTCLIQISTPREDLLIDPLALDDLGPLAPIFADPAIEKVFHAAEYDLICLKRDFDFDVVHIFDTMAAARVCGFQRIGLGNMLEDQLGVKHPKKYQTANWARRPLPPGYRRYAQMDAHYLLELRDALHANLRAAGRLEEAREYFADVTAFELKSAEFDPEGYWLLFRPKSLDDRQIAVLRELYILRDELAKAVNHPPQRLISKATLLQIVEALPRRRRQLERIRGLPGWLVRQSGHEIIEAVQHGLACKAALAPPRPERIPAPIAERYNALHSWRRATARARGVESDVIISRNALWDIARRRPVSVAALDGIPGLGPWRRAKYGAEIIAVLAGRRS